MPLPSAEFVMDWIQPVYKCTLCPVLAEPSLTPLPVNTVIFQFIILVRRCFRII